LSIADRRAEACSVSPRRDDSNVDVIWWRQSTRRNQLKYA
jgi:hypothetical protein